MKNSTFHHLLFILTFISLVPIVLLLRASAIDTEPPVVTVFSPEGTYGVNESILIDYLVTDENQNISCWYSLDFGVAIDLSDCLPTSLNVSEGSHTIEIYARDEAGNVGSNQKYFTIDLGAPRIILYSPDSVVLNSNSVSFNYSASDPDGLDYCYLWGDFNGSFARNVSSARQLFSGVFSLNLIDGTYLWNVWCIDMQEDFAFATNKTFSIDTMPPLITIIQPSGSGSQQSTIPLTFSVVDAHLSHCFYRIENESDVFIEQPINCSQGSTEFNVTLDGDYRLTFFANDSVHHESNVSVLFNVNTVVATSDTPLRTGGVGSRPPLTGNVINQARQMQAQISDLGDLVVTPGEEKTILITITNTGRTSLTECMVSTTQPYRDWIIPYEHHTIGAGKTDAYPFTLRVPPHAREHDAPLFSLSCLNYTVRVPLTLVVSVPHLEARVNALASVSEHELNLTYELAGTKENQEVLIVIEDSRGTTLSEYKTTLGNQESTSTQHTLTLDVSKAKRGILVVKIIDPVENKIVSEELFMYEGRSWLTGLVSFDFATRGVTYLWIGILATIVGIFSIVRLIWHHTHIR